MILKVKDENGHFKEVILKGTRGEKGEKGDSSTLYPLQSYEIESDVVDYSKPVGHIERYGAKPDFVFDNPNSGQDNTIYIQRAIDTVLRNKGGEIIFGDGMYRIDGTLYVTSKWHRMVTIKGVDGKYMSFYKVSGGKTVLVKNTDGDLFRINLDEQLRGNNGDGGGMYNVTIKNLAIISTEPQANVTGFNMFTTRVNMENVLAYDIYCLVNQDEYDSLGNFNYCDFCTYRNINLSGIKHKGLVLKMPDSSTLEDIYCHAYQDDCKHLIDIRGGAGFTLKNCIFTWQFDNLSSGVDGSTSFVKIDNCKGFTIQDTYIERTYLTNAIILSRCQNAKIQSITDVYNSNTLIKLYNCNNISIDGIYRDVFLTDGYYDIYFSGTNRAISIHNSTVKRRQAEPGQNSPEPIERTMIFGGSINRSELIGDSITAYISYDGSKWNLTDDKGNALNTLLASGSWDNSSYSYQFAGSSKIGKGIIKGIYLPYVSKSELPYIPVLRNTNNYTAISFFDRSTGSRVESVNSKMKCIINVDIF